MKKHAKQTITTWCLALGLGLTPAWILAAPVPVEVKEADGIAYLLRDGEPYFIKGAGGSHDLERLAAAGGNSIRTWGLSDEKILDEAHGLGLTVCAGLWIEHERHGFDYGDEAAVAEQIRRHKATVDRFKDHPAILLWGIGNEVELEASDARVWDVVEAVAAHIKEVAPEHPTMTVTAHVEEAVVEEILKRCPSIDILGSNSYGGIGILAEAIEEAGWEGPHIVTEWGNDGGWEVERTAWGAEIEPPSTEKAQDFALRYSAISGQPRSLGGYAFHWGYKQETTPTWFNIFLEDGSATEIVEVLQYLWMGHFPEARAPRIAALRINGADPESSLKLSPGARVEADFVFTRGRTESTRVHWELLPESEDKGVGGDPEERPEALHFDTIGASLTHLEFTAPERKGPYRLFLYVYGEEETAATANFPFYVK